MSLIISPEGLAVLDNLGADVPEITENLQALTGERPALQIDITDSGVTFTVSCAGVEVTGDSADDAMKALAPETVSVQRAAALQVEAQTALAGIMADVLTKGA